jgi:hypothetical protein
MNESIPYCIRIYKHTQKVLNIDIEIWICQKLLDIAGDRNRVAKNLGVIAVLQVNFELLFLVIILLIFNILPCPFYESCVLPNFCIHTLP